MIEVVLSVLLICSFGLGLSVGLMWQRYTWNRDIKPQLDAYDDRWAESLKELHDECQERIREITEATA